MRIKTQSEIITKVLSRALRLWLRSQVDRVEELQIKITGRDRQILRGYIPCVFLASSRAVYQGVHLGQVQLTGENIRINLGQVLKGKPLRLLEPVRVTGKVLLEEASLKASLSSSLLSNGLTDLLLTLLEANGIPNSINILEDYQVSWQEVTLHIDKFTLTGTLTDGDGNTTSVIIRTGLGLANGQTLHFHSLGIEALPELLDISFNEFQVDLGSHVELEELSLAPGKLSCSGRLTVVSEP
ncbi:MAG: DUF2993 domain-containing protein [Xenococcaceae cyanobacterium]